MAWRHARYSLFCPNNIILPKVGIGGSLQFLQGSPGTPFCSEGVPSIFYRGPRGPLFRRCIFCKHFVAGREEGCRFPTIFAEVLPRASEFPVLSHGPPYLGVCPSVFFASISLLVGRKGVGFPQFLQGSTPHASWFPLLLTRVPRPWLVPFFASVSLLVGRKGVGFPQFLQGSTPHASGFPQLFTWVPWPWHVSRCVFCEHFVAGWEEACRFPNFCRGPRLTRHGPFHFSHESPGRGVCPGVSFASVSLLFGRKERGER